VNSARAILLQNNKDINSNDVNGGGTVIEIYVTYCSCVLGASGKIHRRVNLINESYNLGWVGHQVLRHIDLETNGILEGHHVTSSDMDLIIGDGAVEPLHGAVSSLRGRVPALALVDAGHHLAPTVSREQILSAQLV
jgi:hypothetical protein